MVGAGGVVAAAVGAAAAVAAAGVFVAELADAVNVADFATAVFATAVVVVAVAADGRAVPKEWESPRRLSGGTDEFVAERSSEVERWLSQRS